MKLSYAICVCNESRDLFSLISFLLKVSDKEDEINILIDQIPHCARRIVSSGVLLLSGFYVDDLVKIQTCCKDYGFKFICTDLALGPDSIIISIL